MLGNFRIRKLGKFETILNLTLGVFLMACGYYFFVIPSGLVTGGSTGLSIIMTRYFDLPVSVFSMTFNTMFLILGWIFLGKKALFKTLYGSLLFPALLAVLEVIFPDPAFADRDLLLVTLFAGGLAGLGFGIVTKYGGSTGGTDIAIQIVRKYSRMNIAMCVYCVETPIIIAGALTFPGGPAQGVIMALYAIVVILISGKVSDSYLIGSQSKKAVNIITEHPKEIKAVLFASLRRGVTEIQTTGGFTGNPKTLLIMVILNTEYHLVTQIIAQTDPKAFVYVTPASEIRGEWSSKEEVYLQRGDNRKPLAK